MQKTIKAKLAIGAFAAVMGITFMLPGATLAMNVQALDDQWGNPAKTESLGAGAEKRYYKLNTNPSGMMQGYRVFDVDANGKVRDRGFSDGYFQSQWGVMK